MLSLSPGSPVPPLPPYTSTSVFTVCDVIMHILLVSGLWGPGVCCIICICYSLRSKRFRGVQGQRITAWKKREKGVCPQAFPSFPSPTPSFLFWLSPQFRPGKIPFRFRSSVFLCSPTPRKRLLCRLKLSSQTAFLWCNYVWERWLPKRLLTTTLGYGCSWAILFWAKHVPNSEMIALKIVKWKITWKNRFCWPCEEY